MCQITVVSLGGASRRRTIQYLQLIVTCKQQFRGQVSQQRADPPTASGPHFKSAPQQFSPRVSVHTHAQTYGFAWVSCPTEEQGPSRTPRNGRPPTLACRRQGALLPHGWRAVPPPDGAGWPGERRGTGLRRRGGLARPLWGHLLGEAVLVSLGRARSRQPRHRRSRSPSSARHLHLLCCPVTGRLQSPSLSTPFSFRR